MWHGSVIVVFRFRIHNVAIFLESLIIVLSFSLKLFRVFNKCFRVIGNLFIIYTNIG